MDIPTIKYTYTGAELDLAINSVHKERKPLIENFLYEKSAIMLYADDGVGKSVLTLQACMQATVTGAKVFCEFLVPRGCKVLYFQMERHPDETFERIKHMRNAMPFDVNNFSLSVVLQGTNLQDRKSFSDAILKVVETIVEANFTPDIIVFDPIYTLTSGGLETAEACNSITNFFRIIQLQYQCTILATSHTNRGFRDPMNGGKRVSKDMYGNRFLSAFFTGSYQIEPREGDGGGTIWSLQKNSQSNLEKTIELMYDASNFQSIYLSKTKFSKKERLDNFIKACKSQGKEFSFNDMIQNSGLSSSTLRGYLSGHLKNEIEESSKGLHGIILYRAL